MTGEGAGTPDPGREGGGASSEFADLVGAFRQGSPRALGRAISLAEREVPGWEDLLSSLVREGGGRAPRTGLTGPPGVGKSTLVRELARTLAGQGERIGVVAVDPSSPRTGGALLGDRIRMGDALAGPVFFRSMASGGRAGGLSPAVPRALELMDRFGLSELLVETVGAGQGEVDVVDVVDTVVLVLMPGQGDGIQAMKGGILELADVVVVNKADLPGAEALAHALRDALSLAARREGGWEPPVLLASAERGEGVGVILDAVREHQRHRGAS